MCAYSRSRKHTRYHNFSSLPSLISCTGPPPCCFGSGPRTQGTQTVLLEGKIRHTCKTSRHTSHNHMLLQVHSYEVECEFYREEGPAVYAGGCGWNRKTPPAFRFQPILLCLSRVLLQQRTNTATTTQKLNCLFPDATQHLQASTCPLLSQLM